MSILKFFRKQRIKRKFPQHAWISVEMHELRADGKVGLRATAYFCSAYLEKYDYAFKEELVLSTSKRPVALDTIRDWALPLLARGIPVQVTIWENDEVVDYVVL